MWLTFIGVQLIVKLFCSTKLSLVLLLSVVMLSSGCFHFFLRLKFFYIFFYFFFERLFDTSTDTDNYKLYITLFFNSLATDKLSLSLNFPQQLTEVVIHTNKCTFRCLRYLDFVFWHRLCNGFRFHIIFLFCRSRLHNSH